MNKKNIKNKESEWFGHEHVTPEEKTHLVKGVFDSVADRYDLMNDLMSGGIHRLWKNKFVRMMKPAAHKNLLDVAGGTGDIALRYRKMAGPEANITVYDLNEEMLKIGKDRVIDRGYINEFSWKVGNAEQLPFKNNIYSIYSISFGLRNVTKIDNALREAYRVLKPGGQFFCLEFSHINNDLLSKLYKSYSKRVIPSLGKIITNDFKSYKYLVESIQKFPRQEELAERIEAAGFEKVKVINLSGGIAAIHTGLKS